MSLLWCYISFYLKTFFCDKNNFHIISFFSFFFKEYYLSKSKLNLERLIILIFFVNIGKFSNINIFVFFVDLKGISIIFLLCFYLFLPVPHKSFTYLQSGNQYLYLYLFLCNLFIFLLRQFLVLFFVFFTNKDFFLLYKENIVHPNGYY